MYKRLLTGLALLSLALAPARAALTEAMLPADAVWYVHVDVEQMRNTPVGQRIYQFLDKEVFALSVEVLDKAGAYGIQEWIGLVAVNEIKGCFFNVIGLPVPRFCKELEGF